jgi:hypothetical protein
MSTFGEMIRRARQDAVDGDWNPGAGTHDAVVVEADAFESNSGDAYAKAVLRWVKPGHDDDGRTWDHLMGFKSPTQAQISVGQLAMYGLTAEQLDDLDDIEDLARHMEGLAGTNVTVSCKLRTAGDPSSGVWTNVIGSRTGKSDIPDDQAAFALGDERRNGPAPKSAIAGEVDDDPVPY